MIKITVLKNKNNYSDLYIKGHSSRADYGYDIVCAGISALTIGIINGLTEICHIKTLNIIDDDGFLHLEILSDTSVDNQKKINLFLDTLVLAFEQFVENYPTEVKLKIKEIE